MLHLLIPAGLASLLLLAGCKSPAEEAATYAQQAQQLADAGDGGGALKAIRQAIALRDNNAGYYMLLASIQLRAGNVADAFQAARQALDLDSANRTALTLVANLGLQTGQVQDAESAADRLLALDPGSLAGLQVKGLIALFRNKDEEAAGIADRLLAISPADEAGIIIRSRVLAKAGHYEEALTAVDSLIGQNGGTPALIITKLNLYRVLGKPEDMVRTFEQLEARVPDLSVAFQLDRINLLYKLGRRDDARAQVARLLAGPAITPDDLAVLQRLWMEFDRVPYTRESIKAARDWRDPIALLAIGRYLLWQGQPQLADDLYFSFPARGRPVAYSVHLRAAAALGREASARKDLAEVLERDPGDIDGLLLHGLWLADTGDLGRAIEVVQRARDSDPKNPEVYSVLAGLHTRAGSASRAAQIFEDGLKQLPQNFVLIERYAQFLHESGNKSRAVSASRAFARALPSSVLAWTIMARQCAWAADAVCTAEASAGRQAAATRYEIDDPPGKPKDRGLLGRF